ncbi:MAG: SDR family oxidoreductase, partial [Acidobacteria bacterium]|nr:SDR family oxidoreductase [Acidobacteriota bacterium]
WVRTESQPISIRNVLYYLVQCLAVPQTAGRTLEVGGSDIVTYQTLLQIMAEERGLGRRIIIPVPVLTPFLSSLWIHLVTPVSARMARPLAEGLRNRVVVQDDTAARLMPQQLLGVRESIRIALDAEARSDVESTWSAAGPVPGDPDWAGGDVFKDSRVTLIAATPERVFDVLMRLGGRQGWFHYNRLWRLRGLLDRLAGGPGWKRGRRDPARLSWGEAVGFWRVTELDRGRRLTLRAEMRVPGDAILDFELSPEESRDGTPSTLLTQTARFRPRGLAGLLYWYAVAPFHGPVFDGLLKGIRDASVAAAVAPPLPVGLDLRIGE